MHYIADLHVHSRYSRATSKRLDFENLHRAAQLKGITVMGTGDATHPAWFSEIREKLEPAEGGLFQLKPHLAGVVDVQVPDSCRAPVRFVLQSEISCIYKKDGRTRKSHHLIYFPDLDSQERFNTRLARIGNIQSDGRPILGLDARLLLELMLETDARGVFIPAHIWTPWFSLLGSKSGFDRVEECFGDLTSHIFAMETGLSSDPPMNRRVSFLDGFALVSNSDAHSPAKLGREANRFDTDLSYDAMFGALKSGDPNRFQGTIEFFPEEGKYHLDGHRKCGVRSEPRETLTAGGVCPVCGKPMTVGVLYRVEELADRPDPLPADGSAPFQSLIPLTDLLGEVLRCGPATKKVAAAYERLLSSLGSELALLKDVETDRIDRAGYPLLAEAIRRMRDGIVDIAPGYDGEFGAIRIFKDGERDRLAGQARLFATNLPEPPAPSPAPVGSALVFPKAERSGRPLDPTDLNPEQQAGVDHGAGPLMIVAGPGTGKTHTLTRRMARILRGGAVSSERLLAITFTTRAAEEMRSRLAALLGGDIALPFTGTFHGFCFSLIQERWPESPLRVIDDPERRWLIGSVQREMGLTSKSNIGDAISRAKQAILSPEEMGKSGDGHSTTARAYRRYQELLSALRAVDYEDLIYNVVRELEADPAWQRTLRERYTYIFIDEYQDLNHAQYRLVRQITRAEHNLCVIGDPDQSIYGFRGSDAGFFNRFVEDYPSADVIRLSRNYRSTETILETAYQIIGNSQSKSLGDARLFSDITGKRTIGIIEAGSEKAEAVAIGRCIEEQVGGLDFLSMDAQSADAASLKRERSFADFAVLYRTGAQADVLHDVLTAAGIPCRVASRSAVQDRKGIVEPLALLKLAEGMGRFLDLERAARIQSTRPTMAALDRFRMWALANEMEIEEALASMRRLPIPGVAAGQQHRLLALADHIQDLRSRIDDAPFVDKLKILFDVTGTGGDLADAVADLIDLAADGHQDSEAFFASLSLQTDNDLYRRDVEKVTLMTMHAAKGLEFPVVFVSGCEKGLVPYEREGKSGGDPAEERRLFYVAVTRARQRLYLTASRKRTVRGVRMERALSPFVLEIESSLKDHHIPFRRDGRGGGQVQMPLF